MERFESQTTEQSGCGRGEISVRSISRSSTRTFTRLSAILMAGALLSGCERAEREVPASAAAPVVPASPTPAQPRLPVSLNAVMVTLVNHAADPIWQAAWRNPESDRDWRNLEHLAYQLEIAGALLVIPGTGPMDDTWTTDPDWQCLGRQTEGRGNRAVDAVKARDV